MKRRAKLRCIERSHTAMVGWWLRPLTSPRVVPLVMKTRSQSAAGMQLSVASLNALIGTGGMSRQPGHAARRDAAALAEAPVGLVAAVLQGEQFQRQRIECGVAAAVLREEAQQAVDRLLHRGREGHGHGSGCSRRACGA